MKKILGILGAIGMTAGTAATVVACGNPTQNAPSIEISEENFTLAGGGIKTLTIKNISDINIVGIDYTIETLKVAKIDSSSASGNVYLIVEAENIDGTGEVKLLAEANGKIIEKVITITIVAK